MCYANGNTEFDNIDFDDLRKVMNDFKSKTKPVDSIDVIITTNAIYEELKKACDKHSYLNGNEPASSKELEGHKLQLFGIPVESYETPTEVKLRSTMLRYRGKNPHLILDDK